MTAIRNVGELASPYFLLEVWARRDDIQIDPETYATLKRKARRLVRDARVFEKRDEEPDREWQDGRLDLLGLETATEQTVPLDDGTWFEIRVWSDAGGRDALVVADLAGSVHPDRRSESETDPPSTRFEMALDAYEGDADWGLLLAGTAIRVYRRSSGISQQYLELSLDSLVELDDEPTWKAFAAIFRTPAFAYGDDGVPLIRRVVDESRRHAAALAADMRGDVVAAAEAIIQGVLDRPANEGLVGEPTRARLQGLFEETLYYLYRILFVLYAEAREVLPVSGAGPYATTYSLDHLIELARREALSSDGTYCDGALKRLFALLWHGPAEAAEALGFEPVGGELFDPSRTPTLNACAIDDGAWSRALAALALGALGSARRKLGKRSSFAELGVDQLGSIYEGLLVLEPYIAPGPRSLVYVDGDRQVLEDPDGFRVLRALQAGDFVLESASGRRKGSGSFYTPEEITEYLTHAALDPLVEPIVDSARDDASAAAKELRSLNVCDPAMGSGAFLVQATRVLGLGLARIWAIDRGERVTPDLRRKAERTVVRDCIYGVDLNPLAVALAKVALWLETLEPGRPLGFLDAHLRCGDSLVGVDFTDEAGALTADDLATFPAGATKGLSTYLKKEGEDLGEPVLERLKKRKVPKKAVQTKLPGVDAFEIREALDKIASEREQILASAGDTLEEAAHAEAAFHQLEQAETSLRNRLRAAANFWCAQWFSEGEDAVADSEGLVVPSSVADFEAIVAGLLSGAEIPEGTLPQLKAARQVAGRRHFFHWALEFPEVMLERGGFDAVIGNPPWNNTTPLTVEFFGTYDPTTFRKGVPRKVQQTRMEELRRSIDIDAGWRSQARFLHEMTAYAKPESNRYRWHPAHGDLRKGHINVFRLFVERAYTLLRMGGRLAQVLPESFYQLSQTTGVRGHLLTDGILERCYVFENRRRIFPIHRSVKVVLMVARRGDGPTERFRAAFFVGKDPAGRDRAVGLDTLPDVLAELDREAPELAVDQIRQLAPATLSFPELQTALDAEIAAQCVTRVPPFSLNKDGWQINFCQELNATNDAWRFRDSSSLHEDGLRQIGLRWVRDHTDWWPVVEGAQFYSLEFPAEGKAPSRWVDGQTMRALKSRTNDDGTSVMDHYRVAWRDVASATNERSAIAAVLPPRTASVHSAWTVWGGSLQEAHCIGLASLVSSFCFDYLVRARGRTHLSKTAIESIPAPTADGLTRVIPPACEAICAVSEEFDDLWHAVFPKRDRPSLDWWEIGERRARVDAEVALAYGLSMPQFAAVLCTFPNIDRTQSMLPGEPKSFVTRDLALLAYCERTGMKPPDIAKLMREIGVDLPDPQEGYRYVDERVEAYRQLGAVPYRPTPKGGKPPTDPALIVEVQTALSTDALTVEEVADALEEDDRTISTVLKALVKEGSIFREGKGRKARFYVLEDEEE